MSQTQIEYVEKQRSASTDKLAVLAKALGVDIMKVTELADLATAKKTSNGRRG